MTASASLAGASLAPAPLPALLGRRAVAACLVAAPVLELIEAVTSPLKDGSTAADLAAIGAHRGMFVFSVLAGLLATVLYVPAFLGLARACVDRSPVAARIGGGLAVLSMMGFAGIRALQGMELQMVRGALPTETAAELMNDVVGNFVGAAVLVMFLGGSVIGVMALAVATWRAGLPRPAAVLLVAFPLIDLGTSGKATTILSHAVLLTALLWFAVRIAGDGVDHPEGASVAGRH